MKNNFALLTWLPQTVHGTCEAHCEGCRLCPDPAQPGPGSHASDAHIPHQPGLAPLSVWPASLAELSSPAPSGKSPVNELEVKRKISGVKEMATNYYIYFLKVI